MNFVFFMSVLLKGLGAVLEIVLQMLVIRQIGMEGYGKYTTWINWSDLLFWIFFSGLVKCNTFYLSEKRTSIKSFKKQYYKNYMFPVMLFIGIAILFVAKKTEYLVILLITLLELLVLDKSSTLIAKERPVPSLIGEYIAGRGVLLFGAFAMKVTNSMTLNKLIVLYIMQYLVVFLGLHLCTRSLPKGTEDISNQVSLKKLGSYQRADFVQAMIGQMPVILQFLFVGAFEAGVVSIALLIKKVINFITGPTAKVFLPEFSRLYKENKKQEISSSLTSIMRIQMVFLGPLTVVLIGYPYVVLKILAEELLAYVPLFVECSVVFIVGASLGPCGGVLQMSGKEKRDNLCREVALLLMFCVMLLFRKNRLFVLYGLCVQTMVEAIGKYVYVCKWLGKSPIRFKEYLNCWLIPIMAIFITYCGNLQESFIWMFSFAAVVFFLCATREMRNSDGKILEFFLKKKAG